MGLKNYAKKPQGSKADSNKPVTVYIGAEVTLSALQDLASIACTDGSKFLELADYRTENAKSKLSGTAIFKDILGNLLALQVELAPEQIALILNSIKD